MDIRTARADGSRMLLSVGQVWGLLYLFIYFALISQNAMTTPTLIAETSAPSWSAIRVNYQRGKILPPTCECNGKDCWFKRLLQRADSDVKITTDQLHLFVVYLPHRNGNLPTGHATGPEFCYSEYKSVVNSSCCPGHPTRQISIPLSTSGMWWSASSELTNHLLVKSRNGVTLCLQIWYKFTQGT